MSGQSPIILWYRRDLRLSDHPALHAACDTGRPIIPLFIGDDLVDGLGIAPKWRLGLGLGALSDTLLKASSRLILRRGNALAVLKELISETGAGAVYWSRLYDPDSVDRDTAVKAALKDMINKINQDSQRAEGGKCGSQAGHATRWSNWRSSSEGAAVDTHVSCHRDSGVHCFTCQHGF